MNYRFRKPGLGITVAIIIVTAILFSLGVWQLQRLQWKTALIARIDKAQSELPRDLLSIPTSELTKDEWYNVTVTGTLLNDKELYATPRYLKEQMGYAILTPLKVKGPAGDTYVLINRGWVPPAKKDPAARLQGNTDAPVTVEGVIRVNVDRGWLWRQFFHNSPEKNIWLWYDLPAMQQHANLPLLPIIIDAARVRRADGSALADAPTPFPLEITIRNDHLGYAITWFLIGISGLVIFVTYHLERKPFSIPSKPTSS